MNVEAPETGGECCFATYATQASTCTAYQKPWLSCLKVHEPVPPASSMAENYKKITLMTKRMITLMSRAWGVVRKIGNKTCCCATEMSVDMHGISTVYLNLWTRYLQATATGFAHRAKAAPRARSARYTNISVYIYKCAGVYKCLHI